MQKYFKCFGEGSRGGQNFLSLFHVLDNFKNKIFEKKFGMTKIDRHFLLLYEVICFTLYTREIARNHLLYFLACKCVIYFRMTYLGPVMYEDQKSAKILVLGDLVPEIMPKNVFGPFLGHFGGFFKTL